MQTWNACSLYTPGEVCNALYVFPSLKAHVRPTVRPWAAACWKAEVTFCLSVVFVATNIIQYELNPFTYRWLPFTTKLLPFCFTKLLSSRTQLADSHCSRIMKKGNSWNKKEKSHLWRNLHMIQWLSSLENHTVFLKSSEKISVYHYIENI